MFLANRDAVAVSATGVEIASGGAAAFIEDMTKLRRGLVTARPSRLGRREFAIASAGLITAAGVAAHA